MVGVLSFLYFFLIASPAKDLIRSFPRFPGWKIELN